MLVKVQEDPKKGKEIEEVEHQEKVVVKNLVIRLLHIDFE